MLLSEIGCNEIDCLKKEMIGGVKWRKVVQGCSGGEV